MNSLYDILDAIENVRDDVRGLVSDIMNISNGLF